MSYAVKEVFFTLQGEGRQAGRPAVFCRFAGCNLWTGREADRAMATCSFCDTDFVGTDGPGGGKFAHAVDLAAHVAAIWPDDEASLARRYVVCTGGEPTLQMDDALIEALHDEGFEIAIETNGTRVVPEGIDWICVSPKANAPLVQTSGDELKLVFPQAAAMPERFADLDFEHLLLQPMDGPDRVANTDAAVAYCLAHPRWGISLQTHKLLGLP
ncbi:MAG: 7-carboxy-7-deazaguanine synthase [Gemmatimonadota bacterium]